MKISKNLTWQEIVGLYDKEWVELVDYDWPEEEAHPRSGVVRIHAKSRKEFDKLADEDPPVDSAYVFVGRNELPSNTFLSTYRVVEGC